ncbi:hypothetical protein KI688_011001 [Linnemannia hyalina]|uniref:Uncharacterized protein n=1 Tax=Linnemannia hyalina TaxID=64524 RepID=A0A9P7XY10_9FUNG|nr:hypothetical protein KI688_011001 [Linnemannia hyalina]
MPVSMPPRSPPNIQQATGGIDESVPKVKRGILRSYSITSSDAAVAGSTSPPLTFLETNTNMPRKTRTRTIVRTTTDPIITIKLIHTPSPSDVSSISRLSEMSSNSDSDSCEGLNDLRSVVEAQMSRRQEILDAGGVDLFADFDSTSPQLEAEDEQGGEEEEEEEEEREYYSGDRGTDDEKGDDDEPGSGSGAGVGDRPSHATDNNRYDNFRSSPSQDRSHNRAPPSAKGASPKDAPVDSTVPKTPSVHYSTLDILSSAPTKKANHHSKHNRKRESIAWLDHFLALNNTYRDNLATLHLHLFQSLHHTLSAHTTTLLNLQQQILGIQGVRNGRLDNEYLIELVSTKLSRRMERDLRNQTRFCIGVGELVQQGFGSTLLTVDYEEEDEFEGVRVDPAVVAVKEKKRKAKERKKNGEEMEEEKEEPMEEKELVKLVSRVYQRRLPVDDQWALFRWTELQKPYATLKDLDEARACMALSLLAAGHQQEGEGDVEVQDGIMHDSAGYTGHDVVELTVEEQKEESSSDDEWDSSLAEDSVLIRSSEEFLHIQQQRNSQDQGGLSGDDDIDETQFEMLTPPAPGNPPPGDLGDRDYEHLYSYTSDDNADDGLEPSTPQAGAGPPTRSFYMQDPSHCRLESPVEPLAFSRRPSMPTPPLSSQPDFTTPHSSPAADDSETAGVNSNTEWMRVVRALAATEAASSAPGTRLPIWVVYAPPISASLPSAAASTGTTTSTAAVPSYPAVADCDEASAPPEEVSAIYHCDRREGSRRNVSQQTQRFPPPSKTITSSTTSTSEVRYTRSSRKRRRHEKHSRTRTRGAETSAPATVNNHFRGGTHYHYNGSSTTMSNHRPMSVLSRRSSTSSSSSSLSGPSVFMALTSDSCPSPSRRSSSSLGSRQSLEEEEEEEVLWQSSSSIDCNQGHHQPTSPLLQQSPYPSSSTVHEKEEDDDEDLPIFSQPPTPLSKPPPPLPLHATTSSYYTFLPPVQPAHQPRHHQLRGPTPDPLPPVYYHRPVDSTIVTTSVPPRPVHCANRTSRVRVCVSKLAHPKSQVYQLGNPKWRLEGSLLPDNASTTDNSTDNIIENTSNDASSSLAPCLTSQQESQQQQQQQQRQQQQQLFHRV